MEFASLSYGLRTEATSFDHSKYKFGDAVLWSVHGRYRPLSKLALDLGIDGRYAEPCRAVDQMARCQQEHGTASVPNT